jgi:peptidoglycan/xylan/chitin deacetylase (PgdA/CDA1 family)
LEDRLGREVRHLAYPFGAYNEQVREIAAEAGYETACSVRIGLSATTDDALALHRVPINGDETFLDFISRLSTAQPARALLRGFAQRLRGVAGQARSGMPPW